MENGRLINIKKAIMLSFRVYEMETLSGPYSSWYDKGHLVKGKTAGWSKENLKKQDLEWFLTLL